MKKIIVVVFFLLSLWMQSQSGPRTWGDHVSLSNCNSVAKLGSKVYASYYNGLVYFEQDELNPKAVNKINGLSDVGIRLLRANNYNKKLLVIYDNCNIDIIDEKGNLKNYSDFKLKIFNGKKLVNEVTFYKHLAYLACGFGIVVFDTERLEIKETYYIGNNGAYVDVNQVALNDSVILASTPLGLFRSNYLIKNLLNFHSWTIDSIQLPKGAYSGVINVNGLFLCAYAKSFGNFTNKGQDTLYGLYNNKWLKYKPFGNSGQTLYQLHNFENFFSVYVGYGNVIYNTTDGRIQGGIFGYNNNGSYGSYRDICMNFDHTKNLNYWTADSKYGLFQYYGDSKYYPPILVKKNGTHSSALSTIDIYNGQVAVAPSNVNSTGTGNYSTEGLNFYANGEWSYFPIKTLDKKNDSIPMLDITSVIYDRKDNTKFWIAAWADGVQCYKNNKLFSSYNIANTPNMSYQFDTKETRSAGLNMDKDGNVWFVQSDQPGYLSVIKKNGEYQNFKFESPKICRKLLIDKNNNIWVLHDGGNGITVFKNNNFAQPIINTNYKILKSGTNNGNLQANDVYAIAQDLDGKIWVGTSAGISVFYNPSNIFSSSNFDSEPIKIVQDGNVELLLSKEIVSSIAVDGANNKWVGTAFGGIYCFSSDGQTQLYHFTKANSPLYSDEIIDVNYNEKTGDVFIGTNLGIQTFRSTILSGEAQYNDVIAFPNPVKPNYFGTVLIKGLVDNSIVKIADVAGNMVWEVKSNGGQIEWPITNFKNERVSSGVYVVYTATTDGELRALTKILVVN